MTQEISAQRYHEQTAHTPEEIRNNDFRLDFENKPTPHKIYEDLSSVSLAERIRPSQIPTLRAIAHDSKLDSDTQAQQIDLSTITQLCYFSTGITKTIQRRGQEIPFRAAACTGALYHVDLYLVCGPLSDLTPGVYHFDPRTLSLDVLRTGDFRGVISEAAGDAPVTVVATSTWWRNAWKYRSRAYRHAFWDSGTVLANLLAIAHSLDLSAQPTLGFADDRVADLLGIDPNHEGPVALVPIGADGESSASDSQPLEPIDPDTRPLSDHEIEYDLIQEAYAASTLPSADAVRDWQANQPGDSSVGTVSSGNGQRIDLAPVDDAQATKTPLHWTIRRRGSCREFARETLSFSKVSTVLDRAVRGIPLDVRNPDGGSLQFTDCYLIVNDVSEIPGGAYQYHPDEGTLECLRDGEFRSEAGHLALDQRLAADAGLCVFFLADIDEITERFGDRGYRVAQSEAALTGGRLYLAAYAHRDLGATGLTFYDDEVTAFFSPRASDQTPMFLWTLGRPA
jgi:SagB-type dehydrogenase family enzyme